MRDDWDTQAAHTVEQIVLCALPMRGERITRLVSALELKYRRLAVGVLGFSLIRLTEVWKARVAYSVSHARQVASGQIRQNRRQTHADE